MTEIKKITTTADAHFDRDDETVFCTLTCPVCAESVYVMQIPPSPGRCSCGLEWRIVITAEGSKP